jgi:hypothetical protein
MPTKQEFDFSIDVMKALLWQYNTAARLQSLLEQKQAWIDENHRDFWTNWYNDVFNLQTANDFGLAVWAIILDMPIVIQVNPVEPSRPTWGFEEFHRNFERGNFFSGSGGPQVLTPNDARIALKLRYYQLISRGTVPEINEIGSKVFGDYGTMWVTDNNDMSIVFNFDFTPSAQLLLVIISNDLLPRPAGVSATYNF